MLKRTASRVDSPGDRANSKSFIFFILQSRKTKGKRTELRRCHRHCSKRYYHSPKQSETLKSGLSFPSSILQALIPDTTFSFLRLRCWTHNSNMASMISTDPSFSATARLLPFTRFSNGVVSLRRFVGPLHVGLLNPTFPRTLSLNSIRSSRFITGMDIQKFTFLI